MSERSRRSPPLRSVTLDEHVDLSALRTGASFAGFDLADVFVDAAIRCSAALRIECSVISASVGSLLPASAHRGSSTT
jgi:hypothetical protein